MPKHGVTRTLSRIDHFEKALKTLSDIQIGVGSPEEEGPRPDSHLTNAQIGYIHEHGAPEVGIPARPHLAPGVEAAKEEIQKHMGDAWNAAMEGKDYMRHVALAGQAALRSVKQLIRNRIPPPLAPSTLAKHRAERDFTGKRASTIPLYDTHRYYNSLTWLIRRKGDRAAIRRERDPE